MLCCPLLFLSHTAASLFPLYMSQFMDLEAHESKASRYDTRPLPGTSSATRVPPRATSPPVGQDLVWTSATGPLPGNGAKTSYDRTAGTTGRQRGINWLGTWSPPSGKTWQRGEDLPKFWDYTDDESCTWFVGQWEWDDKKGLHVQFCCGFDGERPGQWVRLNILAQSKPGGKLWIDTIKYGKKNAVRYCSKEDTRVESLPTKGEERLPNLNTDSAGHAIPSPQVANMYEDAVRGVPLGTIIRTYPREFARAAHGITRICAAFEPSRPRIPATVLILYGVPGSGKSNWALENYPFAYRKTIPGKFWEGYNGETEVIFEDFNPTDTQKDEVKLPQLLTWLDEYATRIEFKGGSSQLKANTFIFTSNIPPTEWYKGHPQLPALVRRVTSVMHFRLTLAERVELGLSFEEAVLTEELSVSGLLPAVRSRGDVHVQPPSPEY
uniref:Replication-associated protein n=1 Tax=Muscicapa latirostris CRESS-DNA-virus sp. TaxID=2815046 RepID=A0A8A4XBC7_9VIRU|nr:MAG: replication-associated protein [Muscicapa latirostris CRESS-DNA-virus sp.]